MSLWTNCLGYLAIAAVVGVAVWATWPRRRKAVPPWVFDRLNENDEAADAKATASWRAGMGIFERDSLNADDSLATLRRDHDDFIEQKRLAALHRKRRARQRFWGWLPWSIYRRQTISGLRLELGWLRDDLRRETIRANRYRDALKQGRTLSASDIFAIDEGIAEAVTDRLGMSATDPPLADETFDDVFGDEDVS